MVQHQGETDAAPLGLDSKSLRVLSPTAPKRRHGPQDTARFAGSYVFARRYGST
jgi:hypothetical protein